MNTHEPTAVSAPAWPKVRTTPIPGVLLVQPRMHRDERGRFLETYRENAYASAGVAGRFVQDNVSVSLRGVVRGLHYQWPYPQGKLVSVPAGAIFDVAVDLRRGSPAFGEWFGVRLDEETGLQLYVPPGCAHGFAVLSDEALVAYKSTEYFRPDADRAVRWDDPRIGVEWPIAEPVLSPRDRAAPLLRTVPDAHLPGWDGHQDGP
jgi:dTDP-4-dehydrorhamnose 3,5-epimerase